MGKVLLIIFSIVAIAGPGWAQSLARVGGVAITLQQVISADPAAQSNMSLRNRDLVVLINRQAVINEAKRSGLTKTAEYESAFGQAEDNIALELMEKRFLASHPVSDQQLAETYREIVKNPPAEQYRFRQIIVASYQAAQTALTRLRTGEDFSNLAAAMSQDPSATVGGEVGWQPAMQLSAPILVLLKTLKIEEVAGPVPVPEGFAVLQLLGKRTAPKPRLDEIRGEIITSLQQQAWIDYTVKLRNAQGVQLAAPLPGS